MVHFRVISSAFPFRISKLQDIFRILLVARDAKFGSFEISGDAERGILGANTDSLIRIY